MAWLDSLLKGQKERGNIAQENNLSLYKEKLKNLVYNDEMVEELAPVFAKLHGQEGFEKVFELLETKEQQIVAISGGDWFKGEIDPEEQTPKAEEEPKSEKLLSADEILAKKYEEK